MEKKNCDYPKLSTKKEIKENWAEVTKDIGKVEQGEDGKCVYCGEGKGTNKIQNPNQDKLNYWLVCNTCSKVIKYQQELILATITGDIEKAEVVSNTLLDLSKKIGKEIFVGTIDKNLEFSSVTFKGDKEEDGNSEK